LSEEEYVSRIAEGESLLRLFHRPTYHESYIKGLVRFYRESNTEGAEEREKWLVSSCNFDEIGADLGPGLQEWFAENKAGYARCTWAKKSLFPYTP
jgi:hypothetical protein